MGHVENGASPEDCEPCEPHAQLDPARPSTAERIGHEPQGRRQPFAVVYAQLVHLVKTGLERTLGTDVAEEMAAKAGLRAWKRWEKDPGFLADPEEIQRHAYVVGDGLRKDAARQARRTREKADRIAGAAGSGFVSAWSSAEMGFEIGAFETSVLEVVETLTREARAVSQLVLQGYEPGEIAEMLGITTDSARAHARRFKEDVVEHYVDGRKSKKTRTATKRKRTEQ